ncbi:serine protease [Allostella vacuolata]|nr:serine protease [Stella vacuolata]
MRHRRSGDVALTFPIGPAHPRGRLLRAILATGIALGLSAVPMACAQIAGDGGAWAKAQSRAPVPLAPVPSFAPLVQKVLPAVVNVSVLRKAGTTVDRDDEEGGDPDDDFAASPLSQLLRRFLEQQRSPPATSRRVTLGSGFFIDPTGYIVTSHHVVAKAAQITVIFYDNTQQVARIVGHDAVTDLALLKVEMDRPVPHVAWGDSDTARIGDWVLAVGNPFGLGGTVSSGIVSARSRDIQSGPYDDFLQIDAAINRGNSGGPTFDLNGDVVGVTTAIYTPTGGSVGIAFAVPANLAKPIIDELRARGRIRRGWLGLQLQEVTRELATGLALPRPEGALVTDIAEGSPGARAGFRQGDVVLSFDGHAIRQMRELPLLVAKSPPGQKVRITAWRKGREITLKSVVEEMPDDSSSPADERDTERDRLAAQTASVLGLTLRPLTPELGHRFGIPEKIKGLLVLSVAEDSPFADLGIARGDVIVAINQQSVATPEDVAAQLEAAVARKAGAVLLLINRLGVSRFAALPIDQGSGL